jgi:methylated-DNA-[protein]-cysteine S-methyltransferase
MTYAYKMVASPVGELTLIASDNGLAAILWENDDPARVRLHPRVEAADHPVLCEAERQLAAYFAGTLHAFDLPLDFQGTDFQKRVWAALLAIPFGAVGAANGRNPISIVAPCHRVIGTNGALTGFAGGMKAKEYLLRLEGLGVAA